LHAPNSTCFGTLEVLVFLILIRNFEMKIKSILFHSPLRMNLHRIWKLLKKKKSKLIFGLLFTYKVWMLKNLELRKSIFLNTQALSLQVKMQWIIISVLQRKCVLPFQILCGTFANLRPLPIICKNTLFTEKEKFLLAKKLFRFRSAIQKTSFTRNILLPSSDVLTVRKFRKFWMLQE
jgi:hypothetical protein